MIRFRLIEGYYTRVGATAKLVIVPFSLFFLPIFIIKKNRRFGFFTLPSFLHRNFQFQFSFFKKKKCGKKCKKISPSLLLLPFTLNWTGIANGSPVKYHDDDYYQYYRIILSLWRSVCFTKRDGGEIPDG